MEHYSIPFDILKKWSLPQLFVKILFFSIVSPVISKSVDNTTVPYAIGQAITETVIHRISASKIFLNDNYFLLRLAFVESHFGTRHNTFRPNYYGGIWQVDEDKFIATQKLANSSYSEALKAFHLRIQDHFYIKWTEVGWDDLLKPLFSGLAVRLYLEISSEPNQLGNPIKPIQPPITIRRQANYWSRYYRPEYNDVSVYSVRAHDFHESSKPCRVKLDLVVAIDSSASFKRPVLNFEELLTIHIHFLLDSAFDPASRASRIGMFLFSNRPYHIVDVENNYSIDKMISIALEGLTYFPGGDTRIELALRYGTYMLKNATERYKGAPQIILMITDGQVSSPVKEAADFVLENNITTIVIGIGNETDLPILTEIASGNSRNAYSVSRLDSLSDLFLGLKMELCRIPQKILRLPDKYSERLQKDEIRYYTVDIPDLFGVTIFIEIQNENGSLQAFYSYSDPFPHAGAHDGEIDGVTFIPSLAKSKRYATGLRESENDTNEPVHVTVVGVNETSLYVIYTLPGDHDGEENNIACKTLLRVSVYCGMTILSLLMAPALS